MKSQTRKKILLWHLVFVNTALFFSAVVYAQPVADFSCSNVSGCAPILVSFTDQSSGNPTQWKWDLGNGTASYLQNPSVTYFNPGSYTVKLVIKAGTMEDSIVKVNRITVYGGPVINFNATQTTGCNQLEVGFTDQTKPAVGSLAEWKWDFGDGILSDVPNPVHRYDQLGNFNITLKVKNSYGCSSSLLKTAYIKVNGIKAGFTNAVNERCSPNKIAFANATTGNGSIKYNWFFGNGDTSATASPVYTYASGGNYQVKLLVSNQFGCIDSATKSIKVDTPVSAVFTGDNTKGCKAPFTVNFYNQQLTGNSYWWSMGDSSTSTTNNPIHQFDDTGNYTIKLIVRNTNGCVDSVKKINYVHVKAPSVRPLNLPDSGCASFTKKISVALNHEDSVLSVLWNFGDGGSSNAISPVHIFNADGYYTVSVVATSESGCLDTLVFKNAIRVNKKPHADFDADVSNDCAYKKVNFTNLSSAGATKWIWEFDNNDISVEKDPVYTFRDTGFATVQLVAKNGGCGDTARKEKFIYLKPSVSKYKYTFTCANPSELNFKNFSLGADQWAWNFGDGTSSTELNPVHNYSSPGNYSVALETWNHTTGCYYLRTLPVKIANLEMSFYASDTVICKSNEIRFTANVDTVGAGLMIWDFGDGATATSHELSIAHRYSSPGTYTVMLVAVNQSNCYDTLIRQSYIRVNGSKVKFTAAVSFACYNTPIEFKSNSLSDGVNALQNWEWNFDDGTISNMNTAPFVHTYTKAGSYYASLKITDAAGCADSLKLPDAIIINRPNALIIPYDTTACTNNGLRLVAPWAETGTTYHWDFGDGGTASTQYVTHSYTKEGAYTVSLIINNSLYGCADTTVRTNLLKVENPVAKFSMSDSFKTCPPLLIEFSNESVNGTDEVWDFGDGSSTKNHAPSHYYSYPGVYIATLTVKGRGGCISQMQKRIIIKGPQAVLSYDPLKICSQQTVFFYVKSTDAISYVWDFNDGTTLNNTDTMASHTYTNTGGYLPKIILADDQGCKVPVTATDSLQIRLPFKMTISKPAAVCKGQSRNLQASGATSYQWSPSSELDNAAIASPAAKPVVTTNYKVIGTDDKRCFTDTGYIMLEVAPLPAVNAGEDKKITVGTALDLMPVFSSDVTEVRWSPTEDIFRNSGSAVTVKPNENTVYTVEVKNASGCVASDNINITVTKAAGELFIPNTFSPNGDGVNDVFYPRSAVLVRIISMKIINRSGSIVYDRSGFNSNDITTGWDGNSRGVKMSSDVYLYIITFADADNKTRTIQGDISLLR